MALCTFLKFQKLQMNCTWIQFKRLLLLSLESVNVLNNFSKKNEKQSNPCNRPCRPVGLWYVEDPTFSIQSGGSTNVSLTLRPLFALQELPWCSFLLETIVWLEGSGKLNEEVRDLIVNWTRDLLACSIVPQRTSLPRVPNNFHSKMKCAYFM
jgi:hypothetical protein